MDDDTTLREKNFRHAELMLEAKQCLGCIHEGVVVTEQGGIILDTSQAAEHILEIPPLGLKSRNIHEFCGTGEIYDDLCDQASREGRALNRSLLVSTGTGKKKLVNMSLQCVV